MRSATDCASPVIALVTGHLPNSFNRVMINADNEKGNDMDIKKAFALATEIAWQGHASAGTAAKLAESAGIQADELESVLKAAVAAKMLTEVPRIGGYVAGKKVNETIFGREYAEFAS